MYRIYRINIMKQINYDVTGNKTGGDSKISLENFENFKLFKCF